MYRIRRIGKAPPILTILISCYFFVVYVQSPSTSGTIEMDEVDYVDGMDTVNSKTLFDPLRPFLQSYERIH
jgi:hypothetical protein